MASCLKACYECCCPREKETTQKYPHIEYRTPAEASASVRVPAAIQPSQEIPLQRAFEFQQPRSEISLHPQMTVHVVSEQPREGRISSSSEHSDTTSATSLDLHPLLQFSLYYDIQRRTLTVHLQQAYNLSGQGRSGSCDPFVSLFLLPNREEIFESKVVYKTANPVFDQMFEFTALMPQEIRRQTLVLRVFDHARVKDDLLGMVALPLEEADLYGVTQKMRLDEKVDHLKVDAKGELLFSLRYKEQTNVLQGIILKATNLQQHLVTGSADPYVKVYLLYQHKRHDKWKSSVKKSTVIPIFNEAFTFDISSLDINKVVLEVQVLNHDRFGRDEVIGVTYVGASVENEMGRMHWEEVVLSPNQPVSRWHTVVQAASSGRVVRRKEPAV